MVKRLVSGTALLLLVHGCVVEETESGQTGGAPGGGSAGAAARGGSAQSGGSAGFGGEGAESGDTGSSGSSGASGADGGSAGEGASPCPAEKPEIGEPCAEQRRCFYPNASEPCPDVCEGECGDALYCNQGNWVLGEDRIPGCGTPDPDCPEDVPEDLVLCPRAGMECRYARTLCQCTPCPAGEKGSEDEPPAWVCSEPDPGCPAILPVDGTSCQGSEDDFCSYGACFACGPFGWHPASECIDGVWVETHGDCQP